MAQLCEKNEEAMGVRGVQCSVMGELKQIRISSFKYLILASLPVEHKQFL
jgi:hypothetical protein